MGNLARLAGPQHYDWGWTLTSRERETKTKAFMAEEIELKLELTLKDADALEASGLLQGDPEIREQRSIYFDTADHALSKKGFSLRIRRWGKNCIQTIKADGPSSAGLFARSEWERSVKGDVPILDYTTPILTLLGDAADTIAPVFEVQAERRTWIVDEGGTTIELVLDRGEIVAGERQAAICEIELELKNGDPAALFTLARRINAVAPLRLGVLTKAERGYGLIGRLAKAIKANPVALANEMTAAQAFQYIVQSCVRQFRLNETLLLVARDPEALHQARVALRRLRSAFSIFKPLVVANSGAALREELRWLGLELGDARNLDVLLERSKPGKLHDGIRAAREAAYDRVDAALRSVRVRALMLDLAEWTVWGDWLRASDAEGDRQQPAREFAVHALDRFHRKVKKGGRSVATADDAARHELRKDAKKLRYAAEFFTSLFERKKEQRRFKKFVAALEELQDHLGVLNDIATAPQVIEQLGFADDPAASALLGKGKRKALLEAAAGSHDDLIDTRRFWR